MGVFEMIVAVVLISTVGGVLSQKVKQRPLPPGERMEPGEADAMRAALDDLNGRVIRLEEERDFYRDLLENPENRKLIEGADGTA